MRILALWSWVVAAHPSLTDYPRPSVAVDVAVLTVRDDRLQVVVVDHARGGSALPGTFLHQGEVLADAAARALADKAGLRRVPFTQLHVFDAPGRDDRGWVLSVGHSAVVPAGQLPAESRLMPIERGRAAGDLLFDHAEIVRLAVDRLRRDYATEVDPALLLGERFTVFRLRRLYEAVFERPLMKDTFRRLVVPNLESTGEYGTDSGRPAEVYRRTGHTRLTPKAWATLTAPIGPAG
jgi:ADP-ribose pyrophosphatase YjhB (NUDIX family)